MKNIYMLFIVVIIISINHSFPNSNQCEEERCPINEDWKPCGRVCEQTCDDLNKTRPCPRICLPANCSCVVGYARNSLGNCVLPDDCPKTCTKPGEVYLTRGPKVEQKCICDDSSNESNEGEFHSGCYCRDGLIRHPNGTCVKPSECPNCDWKTEVYSTCGTACPNTCINFNDTHRPLCPALCVPGCFCKKGLVLNSNGKCIPPEQCPNLKCTKPHEIYNPCGTACPDTCRNLGTKRKCVADCVDGCFCEEGFVRADSGECVQPCECPCN